MPAPLKWPAMSVGRQLRAQQRGQRDDELLAAQHAQLAFERGEFVRAHMRRR